jgi:hypothetical protein
MAGLMGRKIVEHDRINYLEARISAECASIRCEV